jgi:hypothetical protein
MEKRLHRRSFHPLIHRLVSLGTIALALGLAGGAEFLASAHDKPQHGGLQAVPHLRTTTDAAIGEEASFLAENDVAMKMMNEMTVKPSGDVDRSVQELEPLRLERRRPSWAARYGRTRRTQR